jgi:LacI family transcriptional regulator
MDTNMKRILKVKLQIESSRSYGQGLLRGIAKYSRLNEHWAFSREADFYRKPRQGKKIVDGDIDGLIAHVSSNREAKKLSSNNFPTIIQCVHQKITNSPTIETDDVAIGQIAAQHFLERGFKNFAFCGMKDMHWSKGRQNSFRDTLKEQGFDTYIFELEKQSKSVTSVHERMLIGQWLKKLPKPLAIMACNDDRGQDIIAACQFANMQVPKDLVVIGVDNDELICDLSEMPLSSIELATEKAGYQAAELLGKLMAGEKVRDQKIIVRPSQVITRRSTDFQAIEDLEVAESVRFIKDNASEAITVNDVVNAVSLSRRMLEVRFKKALRRTINDVIQTEHIKLTVQLLNETNMSMAKIAKLSGFSDPTYMGVVFKKTMGVPPLKYRKQIHAL